jgi:hypothetical protein
MEHPGLARFPLRTFLVTCALAWTATACGASNDSNEGTYPAGDDGGSARADSGPAQAAHDSGTADGPPDSLPADAATEARVADGATDSGHKDAEPPVAVPSCHSGDRKEWSGPVASTGIAVAVCSVCGASYVVAANGSGGAGQVSVDNGSKTITVDVAAGATATSANLADKSSEGTVTVCATGASHACVPKDPQNQRYCDPYRDVAHLAPERIDQGVDYAGSGPIYALGPGTIDYYANRTDTGWPGGTFVAYKLSAGPAAGKVIYLAENIDLDPQLKSGSFVYNGTALGTLVNASPNSESGWGVAGEGISAEYGCYTEGCTTPLGINFNQLLVCLKAPSGIVEQTGCCPKPTGWPTDWCTTLAGWQ